MTKTNALYKNTELTSVLNAHFKGTINLTGVKGIAHLIIALCKVQSLSFEKLANAFDSKVDSASSLRRIPGFMADYSLYQFQ